VTGTFQGEIVDKPLVDRYRGSHRYGVFLRPSAELIRDCLAGFSIASGQFGFTAAAAYPPHTTLIGSIALADGITETDLVAAVNEALTEVTPFIVHNSGLGHQFVDSIGYDVDRDDNGNVNAELHCVLDHLFRAIAPLSVFPREDRFVESRMAASSETTRGHITVVGHDGAGRAHLLDELLLVLQALDLHKPSSFTADTITIYRFTSEDWTGDYWQSMTWTILQSIRLSV